MLAFEGLPVGDSLWKLSRPWWEFAVRALLVYGGVLLLLRLTGKRQVGQLAPFDLVLLMLLANAVQNAMNAGDNSVGGGFILVATLIVLNGGVGWLTSRFKPVEKVLEGKPRLLVHNGAVDQEMLEAEHISHHELMAALRQAGITEIEHVRVAILEANGHINVIPRSVGEGITMDPAGRRP